VFSSEDFQEEIMRMCATIWDSRDSEQVSWIRELAEKEAASLEDSLKNLVFYDDQTDEAYSYEPDVEAHERIVSHYISFLERRINSFGKGSVITEPDVMV
jgi:hypothetical protein